MTTAAVKISLAALNANYQLLRNRAAGEVAAVVKADAYGLGASAIVRTLWQAGCQNFFVANCAEGVAIRQSQPSAAIYVLEGVLPDTRDALVDANLLPILNHPGQMQLWAETGRPAGVHIDTGMHRLGFEPQQWRPGEATFPVQLMVTHLARADEPGVLSNQQQLQDIEALYAASCRYHPELKLSVTNSAGLLQGLGPEQLGRAGIGLYGGNPYADLANPMQAVVGLYGRILQVRHVPANSAVGYGGSFITQQPLRLATVGIGYADGVPRLLSNNGQVAIGAATVPLVGRVSMDLLHIDVTAVHASEGDWIEVFGAQIPIAEVSSAAQTLDYEIFTGLGHRAPRQYLETFLP